MPGVTRELSNRSDFPLESNPSGTEVVPAVRANGEPIALPVSSLVNDGGISAAHIQDQYNPHNVSATDVGLGNVDNTADADKPLSTPQGTAVGTLITNAVGAITPEALGLENVDNTADADKPISDATAGALGSLAGLVGMNTSLISSLLPAAPTPPGNPAIWIDGFSRAGMTGSDEDITAVENKGALGGTFVKGGAGTLQYVDGELVFDGECYLDYVLPAQINTPSGAGVVFLGTVRNTAQVNYLFDANVTPPGSGSNGTRLNIPDADSTNRILFTPGSSASREEVTWDPSDEGQETFIQAGTTATVPTYIEYNGELTQGSAVDDGTGLAEYIRIGHTRDDQAAYQAYGFVGELRHLVVYMPDIAGDAPYVSSAQRQEISDWRVALDNTSTNEGAVSMYDSEGNLKLVATEPRSGLPAVVVGGQSNGDGRSGRQNPITIPYALMPNGGFNADDPNTDSDDHLVNSDGLEFLRDLRRDEFQVEKSGSSSIAGPLIQAMYDFSPNGLCAYTFSEAQGSTGVGTHTSDPRWTDVIDTGLELVKTHVPEKNPQWGFFTWQEGETATGQDVTRASYTSDFQYLMQRVRDTALEKFNQPFSPSVMIVQLGSHWYYQDQEPRLALAQKDMVNLNAAAKVVIPAYPYMRQGLHFNSAGDGDYQLEIAGATIGVACAYEWYMGQDWKPMHMKSMVSSGTTTTVQMHVPFGKMVVDTSLPQPCSNLGFDVFNSSNVLQDIITGVTTTPGGVVTITTSRGLAAGEKLGFGWGRQSTHDLGTSSWNGSGQLRDSMGELHKYRLELRDDDLADLPNSQVQPDPGQTYATIDLHNWAIIDEIVVP